MDIGDIGFLIIAFIVYMINLISKVNKDKAKKQAEANPSLPEVEPWEVEEPLPPLFENPFKPKKENKEVEELTPPPIMTPYKTSFITTEDTMNSVQEGISSMSDSIFKQDNMEEVSYQDEASEGDISYTNELFHGNVTEELKKAIIYSEILNRKYD